MASLRAVKGMNDVLPGDIARWHKLEALFRRSMALTGYREVRTPLVEHTPLFQRAIGEVTDVVEKEMYAFTRHRDELALRPEGTAGAVRAYVEHSIAKSEPVSRWYYLGPMFRAEQPQAGRYRQFWQYGAECFGDAGPGSDAEMISELVAFLAEAGVTDANVLVNSIGGKGSRVAFAKALSEFLTPKKDQLSEDSQRRLEKNPLRILDSKDPRDAEAIQGAPTLDDVLDDSDKAHFKALLGHLDALGVTYRVDPKLVRGLDYYTRTLFEIKGAKEKLGAGDTLIGGGRYDGMVEELGGPSVPAIGFAGGLERLLIATGESEKKPYVDAVLAPMGDRATSAGLVLARELRKAGVAVDVDTRGGSLKSMLRRANTLGAPFALILGDAEVEQNLVELKDLAGHAQEKVARADIVRVLAERVQSPGPRRPSGETP
jgi:histidyl-tRNA synthetase